MNFLTGTPRCADALYGSMKNRLLLFAPVALAPVALAGCTLAERPAPAPPASVVAPALPPATPPPAAPATERTIIHDRDAAVRLLGANGVTLQWISWNHRGPIRVRSEGGMIHITAGQQEKGGPGKLFLEGEVREIGADYFVFDGTIRITDTPDPGRSCEADKLWHFAVTQERPYWRLREFEWCDYLTDYVDIYF